MAYQPAQPLLHSETPYNGEPKRAARNANYRDFINTLFQEHNQALIGFLAARLKSESEAEDVAQEAYVRLLQLERPGTVSFIRAYLFRIAENLAVDRLRQRTMHERRLADQALLLDRLLSRSDIERSVIAGEQLDLIKAALKELPAKCREACVLHFFADWSVGEIAGELHVSERMVRYHITRGLAHCRVRLDGIRQPGPPSIK